MKIAFCTLGCKVNQYETDLLKEKAENLGYLLVDFSEKADIYIVNSCSVTNMSDRKTRQMVSKARMTNNNAIVIVMGCNVNSIQNEKEFENYKADIILGNEDKLDLFENIQEYILIKDKKDKLIKISKIDKVSRYREKYSLAKGYDVREAIKIEDGCNNFCSYCIIPYVRGRIRSRKKQDILKEAENLAKNGVKEIILVGIEVTSYGKDLENTSLIDIIESLDKINGIERIRLSSLDPRFLTEENIIALSKIKKLCNHFHISMQSLDDAVLKNMNRKYTTEYIHSVCNNLKKYFENPYIATDIIVGFPGETEKEFKTTLGNLEKFGLCEIHVFKYSKRKYTVAASLPNQIDGNIKKRRSEEIINLSKKLKEKYLKGYIGKNIKVLFEHYENNVNTGITANYIKVILKGKSNLCGTIQDVVGISLSKESIIGDMME